MQLSLRHRCGGRIERPPVCLIKNTVANRENRDGSVWKLPNLCLHIDDAAEAIVRALQSDPLRQYVYNIAGDRCPFSDIAAIVGNVLPGA